MHVLSLEPLNIEEIEIKLLTYTCGNYYGQQEKKQVLLKTQSSEKALCIEGMPVGAIATENLMMISTKKMRPDTLYNPAHHF